LQQANLAFSIKLQEISMFLHHKQMTRMAGMVLGVAVVSQADSAPRVPAPRILENRWLLAGADGWDYLTLDSSGERLFMARATRVEVIDTRSGKLIGTIPNTSGVHGVALAEDLKRGYTSNGQANSVTMFNLDTLETIREASIPGKNPDAILYDRGTKRIFTFNGRSHDVTVLDADSLAVLATFAVPGKPEFAVSDGDGHVFDNIESEPGQMIVIDTNRLAIKATWTLPGCANPTGLAIDTAHHRLFSVCDDKVMAITDAITGKEVARVRIGEGPDAAAYDAGRGLVYSSNDDGTLTVVRQESPDRYTVVESRSTRPGARTMALDVASGKVYVVGAELGAAPAPTPEHPHPRRVPLPDSVQVIVVGAH
jgi:DNA-binding beta-propeller fold protein YncE